MYRLAYYGPINFPPEPGGGHLCTPPGTGGIRRRASLLKSRLSGLDSQLDKVPKKTQQAGVQVWHVSHLGEVRWLLSLREGDINLCLKSFEHCAVKEEVVHDDVECRCCRIRSGDDGCRAIRKYFMHRWFDRCKSFLVGLKPQVYIRCSVLDRTKTEIPTHKIII